MVTIKNGIVFWVLFFSVPCFDFLTKQIVKLSNPDFQLLPFLKIIYFKNTGVAFGMFSNNNLIFAFLGIFVLIALVYYIYSKDFQKLAKKSCYIYYIIGLGLIAGGALGNVIDRLVFGYVTDFIYFSWFPAFNVADSCISIGAITVLYFLFITSGTGNRSKNSKKDN